MEKQRLKALTGYLMVFLFITAIVSCKQEGKDQDNDNNTEEIVHEMDSKAKSVTQEIKDLREAGFQIFEYLDEKTGDTIIMQQYFMAFLKRGDNRSQTKEEADSLQALHMAHLGRMYEEGYADISGPFGDDGDLRGVTIYNVPTLQIADSLANMDPSVQAGRLQIEIKPWWAAKGFPLR